jgi:hypothetical protein
MQERHSRFYINMSSQKNEMADGTMSDEEWETLMTLLKKIDDEIYDEWDFDETWGGFTSEQWKQLTRVRGAIQTIEQYHEDYPVID